MSSFTEAEVHQFIYATGLESLIDDSPELDAAVAAAAQTGTENFELWRVIKLRALEKIQKLHRTVRYGQLTGSKIRLPTDSTTPMELDMVGQYEDGIFILELKVNKAAERNAFSELFAYSNYLSEMFALAGSRDIANVLIAKVSAKITQSAYLYDLLIADRSTIVYRPVFGPTLHDLRLSLHLPTDDDFRYFATQLLAYESMACVVVSFHDLAGWFDGEEVDGAPNDHTRKHLSGLSGYTAQLMEAEGLHGFCFVRRRWAEIPSYYGNSLIICAINPFRFADPQRSQIIGDQLETGKATLFFESAELGFDGRLFDIGKRSIKDALTHDYDKEFETAVWSSMVRTGIEVVFTHNIGFRPTGFLRAAYTAYLNNIYAAEAAGELVEDMSMLKVNEITSWSRAWEFMERCGFAGSDDEEL